MRKLTVVHVTRLASHSIGSFTGERMEHVKYLAIGAIIRAKMLCPPSQKTVTFTISPQR